MLSEHFQSIPLPEYQILRPQGPPPKFRKHCLKMLGPFRPLKDISQILGQSTAEVPKVPREDLLYLSTRSLDEKRL